MVRIALGDSGVKHARPQDTILRSSRAEPVTAQFVKVDSPLCWEAVYSGSQIIENETDQFKAKAD